MFQSSMRVLLLALFHELITHNDLPLVFAHFHIHFHLFISFVNDLTNFLPSLSVHLFASKKYAIMGRFNSLATSA